uniref:Intermembrane lipid transfer protein VPS13-like C-terminal domain-containing protein n=1 Tax=Arcella intermedia TaxID=1963864 RepID=A0A6B2L0S7_9EUKA
MDNITFKYEETISKQNLELSIGSGQLDNQLPKYPSQSPIVLSATPSFKKEFFSIKLEKSKYFDNIVFFSNLEVLSQGLEIDLKLDEIFIEEMENYISNFTHHITNVVKHFSGDPSNNKQVELLPTPTGELQSKKFYFKRFLLGEIQLNLTNRISDEMKSKILLKSFSSYNQVPLSLATISFEDNFSTMNDLGAMIADKYLSQLVPQIYKLVGYNDLLGSPLTLFSSIGLGVHDLIVEPAHILLTNPRAFPHSFKSGTKSMLTRFVYSVSDSASKISGTFGKLISSASKQKNFLVEANPVEPRHVGEALTTGSFEFMASVGGGVHHLVMDPLDGLRGEGLFGLVKGIGKGSLAAVSFPILGFLNMVTTVSVGVRNTTTLFGGKFKQQRFRVRPPRCYMSDLYLPRYSLRHALGQYYLQALDLTEPGLHEYRWHTEQGSLIYILSNYSLISIEKATLLVQWVIQYTDINPVKLQQVDNEVHVFRQSAPKPLVVTLKDASEAKSFFDQLNAIINRVFNS